MALHPHTNITGDRGFTLLFSVLIASIMLSIGTAIFIIADTEIQLSTTARESHLAVYASDSGSECALYWDRQQDAFARPPNDRDQIQCFGRSWNVDREGRTFTLELTNLGGTNACATVVIEKSRPGTRIVSRGLNSCSGGLRVERAFELSY